METIKLKYPIDVAGEKIASLNLRRVTVGDLEAVAGDETELAKSIKLISLIGEIVPDDVRKIDAHDLGVLNDKVADFLE